jgi:WD40 repeat protein
MNLPRSLLAALILFCLFNTNVNGQSAPQYIWTTEVSADGKYVALGGDDSTVWVYATDNYALRHAYKMGSMVRCLSWHPREPLLAIATSNDVAVLLLPAQTITKINGLPTGGRGVAWNHNGELLALADGNGVIRIMNKEGRLLRSIKKHNDNSYFCIDWHPSKEILVTGSDEIMLFDTTGQQLQMIKHRNVATGVLTVKWHPSGDFFAVGDYGHDKEGIPSLLQFWNESGKLLKEVRGLSKSEFRNIRWNHAGTQLATASDALRLWNREGKLLSTGTTKSGIWTVAWSKDDQRIITGSFDDGSVKLWSSSAALIRQVN